VAPTWQAVEVAQERLKIGWMFPENDTVAGGGFLQLVTPPPPPPPPPVPLPAQPATAKVSSAAANRSAT